MIYTTYYPCAAASCASFLVFYKYISPAVSSYCCPGYRTLSLGKQAEWNSRTNSSVHALLVSFMCMYILLYDEEVTDDPVWAEGPLVYINCSIVLGYLVSDTIILLHHYKDMGEVFYIFHHGASIGAFYFVMTYKTLPWFANFRLLAEMSTPMVNQRWFLDVLGYPKSSPFFFANALAMAVIFFLARVTTIPIYWLKVYSICGTQDSIQLGRIWYVLLSSCIMLDLINLYWFYKILRGANKLYHNSQNKSKILMDGRKVA